LSILFIECVALGGWGSAAVAVLVVSVKKNFNMAQGKKYIILM